MGTLLAQENGREGTRPSAFQRADPPAARDERSTSEREASATTKACRQAGPAAGCGRHHDFPITWTKNANDSREIKRDHEHQQVSGSAEFELLQAEADDFAQVFASARREIGQVIVGQDSVIEATLTAIFCGGNVLLEGVPGLGKTELVKALSRVLDLDFRRIQFTPDLMPADIIGTES